MIAILVDMDFNMGYGFPYGQPYPQWKSLSKKNMINQGLFTDGQHYLASQIPCNCMSVSAGITNRTTGKKNPHHCWPYA
jgi:hypothetical protein